MLPWGEVRRVVFRADLKKKKTDTRDKLGGSRITSKKHESLACCAATQWSVLFFSSRRRHTRCYRDWSSDVCSSDLMIRDATVTGVQTCALPIMIRHTRCYRDWSSDVCSSD